MKRLLTVFLIGVLLGALVPLAFACDGDEDAPGGLRNGFKMDRASGRLMVYAGGVAQHSYPQYEAHTADDTLTLAEEGSIHSNYGSAGNVTLLLPSSAVAGDKFHFIVASTTSSCYLAVDAPAGQTINLYGTEGTAAYVIKADDEGDSVSLIYVGGNDWMAYGMETTNNWAAAAS